MGEKCSIQITPPDLTAVCYSHPRHQVNYQTMSFRTNRCTAAAILGTKSTTRLCHSEPAHALLQLSSAPSQLPNYVIQNQHMHCCNYPRHQVNYQTMSFRTSTCTDIDKAQKKRFTKNNNATTNQGSSRAACLRGKSTRAAMCRVSYWYQH